MNPDIERLADIIAAEFYPAAVPTMEGALNSIPKQHRRKCIDAVRAILTELREPSEGMVDAALWAHEPTYPGTAKAITAAIDHLLRDSDDEV